VIERPAILRRCDVNVRLAGAMKRAPLFQNALVAQL
jgi:hypothetical protein